MVRKELVACASIVMALGCSNGETAREKTKATGTEAATAAAETATAEAQAEPRVAAKPWDASLGTATVRGVVKFTGNPPRRRPIEMGGKPECAKIHSEPVLDESIIVNPDGTLRNVFVWVKKGLQGWSFPTPGDPVVLDQKGCTFRPHVCGVQVRQPIEIKNSDEFAHNVHALPFRNQTFNFTQAAQQTDLQRFDRPDVLVRFKCDIHGWMSSYMGVVPHPYFAVTGEDGNFALEKLPPGEYVVEAVHEELGKKTVTVSVSDSDSKEIEFEFAAK